MGEHQLDKLGVTGSSPVPPIGKAPETGSFLLVSYRREAVFRFCKPAKEKAHREGGLPDSRASPRFYEVCWMLIWQPFAALPS